MTALPANIDLRSPALTSSTQLFASAQYTLPQLRAIHAALHSQIDDVSARLRTQVGGSYRELLGTADTIVSMRDDMDVVRAVLGGMGGRCGRGVVGAKVSGLREFVRENEGGAGGSQRYDGTGGVGDAARGRLLEAVELGLGKVLREKESIGKGDRLVLAARLHVLGRLLVKSSAGGEGLKKGAGVGVGLEEVKKSLETVHRARLTRSVDAVLRSGSDKAMKQGDVLKALSAYSLATSSGARDVLRHFLSVRGEAITMALEEDEDERVVRNPRDVLKALGLYTKTLQDVQTLVPYKLMDTLSTLKEERLLENASLKEMEGLRLDVYKRWCGDEIQFYTPFIRHDDLDGNQAREMLTNWAKKGSEVLLQGLDKTLEGMTEFKAIVELRTSVLKLWIAEGGKARGFDPSVILNQLRDAFNKHMLRVLEAKVIKLRLLGSEVSAALEAWREGITDRHQSLWDVGSFDTDLSNGAAQFTQDVVARLYGRNDVVSKAVTSYKSWFHVVDDVGQVVDQLKRQRWDNDIDEIEDEKTIEERQKLLAKDDPLALSEHLNRLLVKAFKRLDEHLMELWETQQGGPNNGAVAMYFLRLLRDIRARLPDVEAVRAFGIAAVPSLHKAVAAAVVVSPLDEFATVALARKTVVGRSLWEGQPALPGSPSPEAFRFLRNLSATMDDAGGDLWSPAAVTVLKRHLSKQLSGVWLEALGKLARDSEVEEESGAENNDAGGDEAEQEEPVKESIDSERRRDLLVQWLLDIHYLRSFLGSQPGSEEDTLNELENAVYQKTGLENAAARERLTKASQDYVKKTGLLFGLLT
ncbi:hypothetical protein MFIFM68171_10422 [Madurella fahalii]|uniref:Conserved oligomeric Golgi complex subunit 1 n=1 Tax=Madurella fahalii TaxID=1157608 RepID=A0ABQ0GR68_9PEZI